MAITDNYLPCDQYAAANDSSKYPGFKAWQDPESGGWFFAAVTNLGRVVLRSESYTNEAGRDNGIESVQRNRDLEERYSVVQEADGQWYIVLKAGNHQEIARSCPFGSEADARAGIALCFSNAVETAGGIIEDYLACEAYAGHAATADYPGFTTFTSEETGEHYFAMVNRKGQVVLRSEAYKSEASRNNGIESVQRNRELEERYSAVQDADGQWYLVLKAGNHQEIARSCGTDSEAGAWALRTAAMAKIAAGGHDEDYLPCEAYTGHTASEKYPGFVTFTNADDGQHYFAVVNSKGEVQMRSEAYTTESARNNGIESVLRNRDNRDRYSTVQDEGDSLWYILLKAGNHQEIARSCGYENEGAAAAALAGWFEQPAAAAVIEDYLHCTEYAEQPKSVKHPGFTIFTAADGQHYFAMVDGHDNVILRSEGYKSEDARDNGIESVLRNRDIEARYTVIHDPADDQYYLALKAGNHQEIARSCSFPTEADAKAHLLHCYSREALEKIATGEGEIIEDYLHCDAYKGHPASAVEGFTVFQAADTGLHYFAMLDDDGNVALKSEGYKDPTRRDNGIESVIRNRGIKDHWREMEDEHGHYMSLRAVNHQEIARTCHYKDKAAMLAWFLPLLGAHGGWGNDAEPEEVAAIPLTPVGGGIAAGATAAAAAALDNTPPPPVVVNTSKPEPATLTTHTDAAPMATSNGNDWWKWLLGLLLLGLLAWLLLRGCDGCGNKADTGATSMNTPVPTAPVDTMKKAPAVTGDAGTGTTTTANTATKNNAASTCDCNNQTDPVFRMGTGTPQPLHRLGTNPEFGDSHGLSPTEFYNKLSDRHKNNKVDRRFLDRMFKAMGYANGFADAKPEQFSAVELAPGTVGNIGYSKAHKTLYARLDTQGKDLLAFRIKAANGCDLHFMKTCGNHMFFCGK